MKNLFYILLFIPFIINAQYTFDKRYNEDLSLSYGSGLMETDDYYICYGSKGDFGQNDTMRPMFLVIDKQGNIINNQEFNNNVCEFTIHNYVKTSKDEYIGVGSTRTPGDTCGLTTSPFFSVRKRMYLHKLDKFGNLIWQRNYGDTLYNNKHRSGTDIVLTDDGNYYIYGSAQSQVIYKINESGDVLWSKNINAYGANKYLKKVSNGYLFYGVNSAGNIGATKFNNSFDSLWTKPIGVRCEALKKTKDNNFIISSGSYTYPIHTTTLTKIDQEANILWSQNYYDSTYKNPNPDNFRAGKCVTETSDGNFVTAYNDIIKVNKEGKIIWKHRYIKDNVYFYYSDVIETKDGGFLLTGRTGNTLQTILTKVDCNGNLEWNSESCLLPTEEDILVFPNPFSNKITFQLPNIPKENTLEINIYNILGQKVFDILEENQQIININTSTLSKSIYLYQIKINGKEYKKGKIIKE